MKKLMILLVVLALSPLALAKPPEGGRGGMMESLNLTAEQRAQIKEIRASGGGRDEVHAVFTDEQRELVAQWRADHGKGKEKRLQHLNQALDLTDAQSSQVKEILAAGGTGKEIRAVLTEEQQVKFDALPKKKGKGKGKGKWKDKGKGKDKGDSQAMEDASADE